VISKLFPIDNLSEQEKEILRYFSVLPSIEMSFQILCKMFGISDVQRDEFYDILKRLSKKKGWLVENKSTYKCHQVVQVSLREKLSPNVNNLQKLIDNLILLTEFEDGNYFDVCNYIIYVESLIKFFHLDLENDLRLIHLVCNISNIYETIDETEKSLNLLEPIYDKIKNLDDKNTTIEFVLLIRYLSGSYSSYSKHNDAKILRLKAIEILAEIDKNLCNEELLIRMYCSLSFTYFSLEDFDNALKFVDISISLAKDKPLLLANAYDNKAFVWKEMGGEYLKKSLEIRFECKKIREKYLDEKNSLIASIYNNIGLTYLKMDNCTKALEFVQKAKLIREQHTVKRPLIIALYLNNIAKCHNGLGEYKKALKYAEESIEIKNELAPNRRSSLSVSYHTLADIHLNIYSEELETENYYKALDYIDEAIRLRKELSRKTLIEESLNLKNRIIKMRNNG
jgi:tetratricopeptide (TPR) repeat protein